MNEDFGFYQCCQELYFISSLALFVELNRLFTWKLGFLIKVFIIFLFQKHFKTKTPTTIFLLSFILLDKWVFVFPKFPQIGFPPYFFQQKIW